MLLERVIYSLLCVILMGYILKRCVKTKSGIDIALLGFQMVSVVVQVMSIFKGTYPNYAIQAFILIFSIIIPSFLFVMDYRKIDLNEILEVRHGDRLSKKGKYEKAIDVYKKIIARNPKNAEAFVKIAHCYNATGDRRTAFDRFAKAIELNRNDYHSYYEVGIIFNDMNKKKDAEVVLDNALRIKPDYTPASELLALVLCAQNKFDDAIHVYQDAIRYHPDNYQLHYSLGIVRTELRDFNEALECYEKAIKLKPDLYEAYFSMGQIHLLRGEFEEATEKFKKAAESKDFSAKSYYQLAKTAILQEREIDAISYIEYAVELDPGYRYKAETEPLFQNIKDYLKGMHMVSDAQMKLEKAINEKVKFEYEKEENKEIDGQEKIHIPQKISNIWDVEPVDVLRLSNMQEETNVEKQMREVRKVAIKDIKENEAIEFNFMDKYRSRD